MKKVYEYSNGVKLLYTKNTINNSTSVRVNFDCGARCDGKLPGLAHLCEHALFDGTKTKTKAEISKIQSNFFNSNAYTSFDRIMFIASIMTNEFTNYLDFLAEILTESTFAKQVIEEEKKVVKQEIVASSDNYARQSILKVNYALYGKDYYQNEIIGTEKSIDEITSKELKQFAKKYFVSNNCYVMVCSPYSEKKVIDLVKKHLASKLMFDSKFVALPYGDDVITNDTRVVHNFKDIDKNFLFLGFKTPVCYPDMKSVATLDVLTNIMNDLDSGFMKTLRFEKGLVYSANAMADVNQVNAELSFRTEVSATNIKACIDVFAEYVKNLKQNGITEEMLSKNKREEAYWYETMLESPSRHMLNMSKYRKYNRFVTTEEIYKTKQSVTLEEINNLIHSIFDSPKVILNVYGKSMKKDLYNERELKKLF